MCLLQSKMLELEKYPKFPFPFESLKGLKTQLGDLDPLKLSEHLKWLQHAVVNFFLRIEIKKKRTLQTFHKLAILFNLSVMEALMLNITHDWNKVYKVAVSTKSL